MNGFVQNAEEHKKGMGADVMSMFTNDTVPIISTLAKEFAIFDRWHASVPGSCICDIYVCCVCVLCVCFVCVCVLCVCVYVFVCLCVTIQLMVTNTHTL